MRPRPGSAALLLGTALLLGCRAVAAQAPDAAGAPVAAPPESVDAVLMAPVATPPESAAALARETEVWPSLAAIDSSLVRADAARDRLADADRAVLDELLAAAREMRAAGDVEAAALLAADAMDYMRSRSR